MDVAAVAAAAAGRLVLGAAQVVGQLRFQDVFQDAPPQAGQQAVRAEEVLGLVAVLKQLAEDFIRYVFNNISILIVFIS